MEEKNKLVVFQTYSSYPRIIKDLSFIISKDVAFNEVAKITTPTLWMGGSDDWNCPILNSEQMYQAMKRLGKETQLVVYPGENHIVKRPSFVKDMLERFLQWFDNYVK